MNTKQRNVLRLIVVAFIALVLYPPYTFMYQFSIISWTLHAGLFTKPPGLEVETGLLFAQLFAVCVIGGVVYLLTADRK